MSTHNEMDELHARARVLTASLAELTEQREAARNDQIEVMRAMHAQGQSWVEIGKLTNMTATAAMYATGHATRTPRRKPTD